MDQDALVNEPITSGSRLIEALTAAGFDVRLAFWAKPTEAGRWYLYLASPIVDEKGPAVAYRLVQAVLRKNTDLPINLLEVRVIGLNYSLTEEVLALTDSMGRHTLLGMRHPTSPRGVIRIGESTIDGISIDEAYIYTPPLAVATTRV